MSYTTASALRAKYPILTDTMKYPDATLNALVAQFEQQIAEPYRGVAFESRTATYTTRGSGLEDLLLPWPKVTAVSTVTVAGSTVTVSGLTLFAPDGILHRPGGWDRNSVVSVAFTHGYTITPNAAVRACQMWVRGEAVADVTDDHKNTVSFTDDSGFTYRESTPDWNAGRPTGYMAVDAQLNSLPDLRIRGV